MSWPLLEPALVAGIRDHTGKRTATKVAANVEALDGFVRVSRGPGSDDTITDSTLVDVECFHPDYGAAAVLAELVRQWFLTLTGQRVGGVLVDSSRTATSPMWVDYRNPKVNRFVASYRIEYRRNF